MTESSETAPAGAAKERLENMIRGFDSFEGRMKTSTRKKREAEEKRLEDLRKQISTLAERVRSEEYHREQSAAAIQQFAETEIANVEERIQSKLEKSDKAIMERIDILSQRLDQMEQKLEQDKRHVLAEVERRNRDLAKELETFNKIFMQEREDRLRREEVLSKRQAEIEQQTNDALDTERSVREQACMRLKKAIDAAATSRNKADERFQNAVTEEIAELRNAVRTEEKARIAEDDEILDTLNRYIQKMQASLQIVNSSDTELVRM